VASFARSSEEMLTRQRQQVGVLGPFSLGVTVALLIPALGRTSGGGWSVKQTTIDDI